MASAPPRDASRYRPVPRHRPHLDAICLKALRKRPEDRYGTAGELAADLRRYLRASRWWRTTAAVATPGALRDRYRGRLTTATALVLALAAVIVAAGAYRRAERLLRPEAPAPQVFPFSDLGASSVEELQRAFAAAPDSVEAGAAVALGLLNAGRPQEARLVVARLRQIPGREEDPLTDYVDGSIAMDLDEPQRALVLFDACPSRRAGRRPRRAPGQFARHVAASWRPSTSGMRGAPRWSSHAKISSAPATTRLLARVLNDLAIERFQRGEMEHGEALLEQAVVATRAAGRRPVVILATWPIQRWCAGGQISRSRSFTRYWRCNAARRPRGGSGRRYVRLPMRSTISVGHRKQESSSRRPLRCSTGRSLWDCRMRSSRAP